MKVTVSPSASVAASVPTEVSFSSTLNALADVITGLLSFKLLMLTVMSWVAEFELASVTVTVAV